MNNKQIIELFLNNCVLHLFGEKVTELSIKDIENIKFYSKILNSDDTCIDIDRVVAYASPNKIYDVGYRKLYHIHDEIILESLKLYKDYPLIDLDELDNLIKIYKSKNDKSLENLKTIEKIVSKRIYDENFYKR